MEVPLGCKVTFKDTNDILNFQLDITLSNRTNSVIELELCPFKVKDVLKDEFFTTISSNLSENQRRSLVQINDFLHKFIINNQDNFTKNFPIVNNIIVKNEDVLTNLEKTTTHLTISYNIIAYIYRRIIGSEVLESNHMGEVWKLLQFQPINIHEITNIISEEDTKKKILELFLSFKDEFDIKSKYFDEVPKQVATNLFYNKQQSFSHLIGPPSKESSR
ncbi:hypothetical protein PPL_01047 [Heterostelium album PN500]|uniref:Uncharacterized protein n=1 Tax=Heterostelium pallidum (strain ATCC 26659 / Pp 5 / PN500) TaxID=670386 RepID=D3AXY9_HETP5|nr:hypothetical protein PPL_01047 [Heterostelium album PN500]EFA85816.1 hypothetical protein PPL_01047 [Heterostelium album PN500]|eukprot:XP_020437922.1 hypothetical protein PPL_01047 [Heterostelium album PN500]